MYASHLARFFSRSSRQLKFEQILSKAKIRTESKEAAPQPDIDLDTEVQYENEYIGLVRLMQEK
jgi:hypothetical protein